MTPPAPRLLIKNPSLAGVLHIWQPETARFGRSSFYKPVAAVSPAFPILHLRPWPHLNAFKRWSETSFRLRHTWIPRPHLNAFKYREPVQIKGRAAMTGTQ
jgi:hypothetical protein